MYTFQLVGEQISNGKRCSNDLIWLMENCWTLSNTWSVWCCML